MKSTSIYTIAILLLVAIAACAQKPHNLFCGAGFRPTAYIDFSGLPTPKEFPADGSHY